MNGCLSACFLISELLGSVWLALPAAQGNWTSGLLTGGGAPWGALLPPVKSHSGAFGSGHREQTVRKPAAPSGGASRRAKMSDHPAAELNFSQT